MTMTRFGNWMLLLVLASAVAVAGCDSDDEADEPEQQQADELVEQQDRIAEIEDVEPLEGPFEGAHDGSAVTADQFGDKLVDSICVAYENCRNEKLKAVLFDMFLTTAVEEPPEFEDDADAEAYGELVADLQQRQQGDFGSDDCKGLFGPMFIQGGGMDGSILAKAEEAGTISFDEETAGECLAQFGQPFGLCEDITEASDDPQTNAEHVMMSAMSHQHELAQHFDSCDNVFEGTVEKGEECTQTYECVDGTVCDIDLGGSVGECVIPRPDGLEGQGQGGMGPGMPAPGGGGQAPDPGAGGLQ